MSLFAELKRRNVFRVALAYFVLAWIILQVGETMAPALHLPEWVNSLLAFFLILGFPLAMFFAWAFELTPDGLKLEKNVDREASITPTTGRKLDRAIIAMLIVALAYFVWQSQRPSEEERVDEVAAAQETSTQRSIAVLPFLNMSSDAEQEYFSDGLSEELLNLLSKIPELRVTSRTSAFSYKGKNLKISEVGRELNVDHVLEGSVRKSGNKVRITAQLIQVESDTHIWSETWDRNLDDVFVIQDEIAKAVVDELKVRLLGELPQVETADPEAYSLFLQARHTITQRTFESLARGEALINRALEIDADYVPAWVLKALIHSQQGDIGARLPKEAFPLARAAVDKALSLDPGYGRAHALLADILGSFDRDYDESKREIEIALAADPGDVDTLYQASIIFTATGDPLSGLSLSQEVLERDPLFGPNYAGLGYIYNVLGRYEESAAVLRRLVRFSPNANGANYYLANALFLSGRIDEALLQVESETLDGFRFTGLAIFNHTAGNTAASDAALAALLANESKGWDYQYVVVHAWRGEFDMAFAALEDAYQNRDTGIQLILGDPFLDNIRDDPRFDAFVDKLGIRLHD